MNYTREARRYTVIALDVLAVAGSYTLAFLLRFDFSLAFFQTDWLVRSLPLAVVAQFGAFFYFDLYAGMWQYSTFSDMINIAKAVAVGSLLTIASVLFIHHANFPRSILLNFPLLTFISIASVRFAIRWGRMYLGRQEPDGDKRKALIIGAGDLGENLLRQIKNADEIHYDVLGFIDDNPVKWGLMLHGHRVFGGRDLLPDVLRSNPTDEIILAVGPERRGEVLNHVMKVIRGLNVKVELKIAPSLREMLGSRLPVRKVSPADLLNRKAVQLDAASIANQFNGKTVLISGAGGTIGAELSRQVLEYNPQKVVILENHATSLFYVTTELNQKAKGAEIVSVLGDARDAAMIERVFQLHQPDIVLHAAAHKHLPQLELKVNVHEGVQNNVLATHVLADAAHRHNSESFLLISTDKAVRPTSVMGMTKRAAEIVSRSYIHVSRTRFVSVRFGNVLGSSGSMLKIFQEQIANRKPISVTHPEATRYFMLVEEAVQLILQAVCLAKGGEIFTLNMGTPMNIMEAAKNLILLSGLVPGQDIPIQITGLRPGEKLHEELFEDQDQRLPTPHPDIFISKPNGVDYERTAEDIRHLRELLRGDVGPVIDYLRKMIRDTEVPQGHSTPAANGTRPAAPSSASEPASSGIPSPA